MKLQPRRNILQVWALIGLAIAGGVGIAAADEPLRQSLEDALALALANNPELAEARLRTMRTGVWPTLRARGGFDAWSEDQRLAPATRNGVAGVFGSSLVSAELVASVPLYTGGRLSGERETALWNLRAGEDRAARVREVLALRAQARPLWTSVRETYGECPPAEYAADRSFKARLRDIDNAAEDMERAPDRLARAAAAGDAEPVREILSDGVQLVNKPYGIVL